MHVEDHPLEYFDFEGVIPAGEYGGGDVIVWDGGTWEPHEADDPARGGRRPASCTSTCTARSCAAGSCWSAPGPTGAGKEEWLLLHKHDEYAVDGWDPEDHPRSVLSRAHQRRGEGRPGPAVALGPACRAAAVVDC